jgi:pimeloyl-ACP methyl ester carboxylesterase
MSHTPDLLSSALVAPRRTRVVLDAGPVHVTELGPAGGTPLVFLHGVLANAQLWLGVAERLAANHRCLLLDLPLGAHAEAMAVAADLSPEAVAALVIAVLDALAIPEAVLVGNDSGGALCQLLIASHPERLRAVVLTSSDAYGTWLPLLFKPFELAAFVPALLYLVAQLLRWSVLQRSPLAFGWLSKRLPAPLAASFVGPLAREPWARRDVAKFLRGISPRLTLRAATRFSAFERPVLLLWSTEDRFFRLSLAERLARDLPNAQIEQIDDAYTFSPIDAPARVADAIEGFLSRAGLASN